MSCAHGSRAAYSQMPYSRGTNHRALDARDAQGFVRKFVRMMRLRARRLNRRMSRRRPLPGPSVRCSLEMDWVVVSFHGLIRFGEPHRLICHPSLRLIWNSITLARAHAPSLCEAATDSHETAERPRGHGRRNDASAQRQRAEHLRRSLPRIFLCFSIEKKIATADPPF